MLNPGGPVTTVTIQEGLSPFDSWQPLCAPSPLPSSGLSFYAHSLMPSSLVVFLHLMKVSDFYFMGGIHFIF